MPPTSNAPKRFCSFPGCGRKHNSQGLCAAHVNMRNRTNGAPLTALRKVRSHSVDFAQWFWSNVDQSGGPTACWPWATAKPGKYGTARWPGSRNDVTHRIAYELAHGPIPEGMFVCHECDNPPCCNPGPGHLFLGTNRENIADMVAKGRNAHGNAYPQTKLTPEVVVEIRRRAAAGETHDALGREFGVCRVNVTRVVGRRLWAQVAD